MSAPTPPPEAETAGLFVSFEGIEGCGKSTQIAALAGALRASGGEVELIREPGGTELGERIRELLLQPEGHGPPIAPEAEALLFAASRAQLIHETIRPALARGACVLADRFTDSTVAYQCGARGLPRAPVEAANALARGDLRPALTFLFDLEPRAGLERALGRGRPHDRFESEAQDFHAKVRAAYLEIARGEPERVVVVDATLPRDEITRIVRRGVFQALDAAAADAPGE